MGKGKTLWNYFDKLEGDKMVWIIVLMLMLISVLCMFSSSSRLLVGDQTRLDIVKGQVFLVLAGLAVIIVCYNIGNLRFLRWCSKWGFAVSMAQLLPLLARVDMGFIRSIEINGARRIIQVGPVQLHVFEVVKVAMALYLSWAMDAFKKGTLSYFADDTVMQKWLYIYGPFVITFLMVIPGSNSAALFIGGIMGLVILLGGGSWKDFGILVAAGTLMLLLCLGIWKISDGKYLGRIGTGVSRVIQSEDWEAKALEARIGTKDYFDALDKIRQPYSAKIAVHQGGIIGKGPGRSTQRYIVPDISEDYMYSFIIEEYGLVGGLIVLILYVSLLARGSIIVRNCGNELYPKLAVAGLTLLISGQAFLHMLVNVDIGPMTGQTLPLISHGTSAFLCFCVAFGVILSISRIANKRIERERREAEPLMEMHQQMRQDLDDLDDFESGGDTAGTMEEEDNYDR